MFSTRLTTSNVPYTKYSKYFAYKFDRYLYQRFFRGGYFQRTFSFHERNAHARYINFSYKSILPQHYIYHHVAEISSRHKKQTILISSQVFKFFTKRVNEYQRFIRARRILLSSLILSRKKKRLIQVFCR